MACFIVPAAEAVITTIAAKAVKSKEKALENSGSRNDISDNVSAEKIPFSRKLKWLNNMLWGGSALLAFEHIWHGEVEPWFPFLTAAGDPSSTAAMIREMAVSGVSMSVLVTSVWLGMAAVSSIISKRETDAQSAKDQIS